MGSTEDRNNLSQLRDRIDPTKRNAPPPPPSSGKKDDPNKKPEFSELLKALGRK